MKPAWLNSKEKWSFTLLALLFLILFYYFSFKPARLAAIFALWLTTFAFFKWLELHFRNRPAEKVLITLASLFLLGLAMGVLYYFYMYDWAMILQITEIPIALGYLPYSFLEWFRQRIKRP